MADYTEQRIDLVINRINQAKYDELKLAGEISDEELYIIIDHDDLFYYKTELYTRDELEERFSSINALLNEKATKTELEAVEQELITKIDQKDENLETRLSTVENTEIPNLKSSVQTNTSNISTVSTNLESYKTTVAKTYLKKTDAETTYTTINTHNSAVTNLEGLISAETSNRNTAVSNLETKLETEIADVKGLIQSDTTNIQLLGNRMTNAENKLSVLNGDENTEGSVKNTVNTAIANVVGEAPEAFDTLKEISDWLANGENLDAADIITSIDNVERELSNHKQEAANTYATKTELAEFSPVTANPTLTGGEDILDSIEIDGVNYQVFPEGDIEFSEDVSTDASAMDLRSIIVGSDVWNLAGGGSDVYANETIIGTEPVLESLKVDGTNYTIGRDDFVLSTETKSGAYDLKSLTVGGTNWNISSESVDLTGYATETFVNNSLTNKLDKSMIVYSETEPENPVEGMIWFSPAQ